MTYNILRLVRNLRKNTTMNAQGERTIDYQGQTKTFKHLFKIHPIHDNNKVHFMQLQHMQYNLLNVNFLFITMQNIADNCVEDLATFFVVAQKTILKDKLSTDTFKCLLTAFYFSSLNNELNYWHELTYQQQNKSVMYAFEHFGTQVNVDLPVKRILEILLHSTYDQSKLHDNIKQVIKTIKKSDIIEINPILVNPYVLSECLNIPEFDKNHIPLSALNQIKNFSFYNDLNIKDFYSIINIVAFLIRNEKETSSDFSLNQHTIASIFNCIESQTVYEHINKFLESQIEQNPQSKYWLNINLEHSLKSKKLEKKQKI